LTLCLRIAIGLATALGQAHRRGLIHKDIKPSNALVDDAGNVRLTGFGIASRLPHECQPPASPEVIAGTLPYMAPEQTGRMNRSIDARSDHYALGVTLYQMLTGTLPFTAVDPLEWVHCHIARQPPPPGERAIVPWPLSNLTMKLLAKKTPRSATRPPPASNPIFGGAWQNGNCMAESMRSHSGRSMRRTDC
jgi:serine/threonine protein kinase